MWILEKREEKADVLRPVVHGQADASLGRLQGLYQRPCEARPMWRLERGKLMRILRRTHCLEVI